MIAFWISAAGLSAAAGALVLRGAARAERAEAASTGLNAHRRQLDEIDSLAGKGLLDDTERKAARAEAGRRLLAAADAVETWSKDSVVRRRAALLCAVLGPLAALLVYIQIGSPEQNDQPYAQRVAQWRATDPSQLEPEKIAAVLESIAAQRPGDAEPLKHLALARSSFGDLTGAEQALRKAVRLAPGRADLWTALGETFVAEGDGEVGADARLAFREALKIDPSSLSARYHLARGRIADGEVEAGLADWRTLAGDIPAGDPRRVAMDAEIAQVEAAGRLPIAAPAAEENPDVQGMIAGMVQGLAARLEAQPDDPDGWIRLVRAYAVLGDAPRRDAAFAQASRRFDGQPKVIAALRQAVQTPSQAKSPQ